MKIIFIRHGKDDDQYRGGWSSHDLLPEGVQQAKLLAQHLKTHQSDYQIAKVISSDLKRTMTTAKYIADALALSIQKEPMLRETNNGVLAGMLNTDASAQYPGLFFSTLKMDERYPGGESPNEFYRRIKLWFSDFCVYAKNSADNILIVTHGGVINIIYHLVNDIPWTNKRRNYKVDHCSIHILDTDTMRFEVENRSTFLKKV